MARRLRAAGCVFADDEARLIVDATAPGADRERLVARRVAGEPLEHLLGWAEFCGLRIPVDPGVFVPRSRTAQLALAALDVTPAGGRVLDLCCGSGAIGIVLATRGAGLEVYASDSDAVATRCASRSLARVFTGDLFDAVPLALRTAFDTIVANVPHVPEDQLEFMPYEAREHEPEATRNGGPDGLVIARRVVAEAPRWLAPGGALLIEIDEGQADALSDAFTERGFAVRFESADDPDLDTVVAIGRLSD
ncbi:putative protein N(5)-glutamine methyltransferase [Agromyces atrinae]|uniref:putative protein N(5)-glutamine methyltransferase n=1 Tax=Agromyces atrinae TaxID=592376 RepID=UPI0019D6D2D5|nr:putative protein N(5)-glutamine methyltransferase [Agromyces atrinae]